MKAPPAPFTGCHIFFFPVDRGLKNGRVRVGLPAEGSTNTTSHRVVSAITSHCHGQRILCNFPRDLAVRVRPMRLNSVLAFICSFAMVACSSSSTHGAHSQQQFHAAGKAETDADHTFAVMSPADHLAKARAILKVDVGKRSIDEGFRNLDAIPENSPQSREAHQLRAAFLSQKRLADERMSRQRLVEERRLAAEEKRKAAEEAKLAAVVKRVLRVNYAKDLENRLLDQGMNATAIATGKDNTTLHIKWILAGRVLAHQMSKESSIFANAREMGFRRIEITDGYDESWYWKLD